MLCCKPCVQSIKLGGPVTSLSRAPAGCNGGLPGAEGRPLMAAAATSRADSCRGDAGPGRDSPRSAPSPLAPVTLTLAGAFGTSGNAIACCGLRQLLQP